MRKEFAQLLFEKMHEDKNIFLVTADLGYGLWDKIRDTFPDRFLNVGSSEMAAMGISIGLAIEGKKPFFYSITPFAIYRPFEMIRNYLDHENIDVTIVGGGRDRDYGYLGFSHWSEEDREIISCLKNVRMYHPDTLEDLNKSFVEIFSLQNPSYINLKR